jgi:malonyl CoA-acyl carrier protein transacylase
VGPGLCQKSGPSAGRASRFAALIDEEERSLGDMTEPKFEPIAIVGVSALFPGSVHKTGFWRDILAGKDLLTEIPESHWLISDYYDPDHTKPDKTYAKRGAFLSDVPFDPMEWGIPPSILPQTDTTQLLGLIVAKQVLEDATKGQFASMDRSKISCILGVTSGQELMGSMVSRLQRPVWVKALREQGLPESEVVQICDRISSSYTKWEEANFPGLLGNVVAGRIANRLDLGGTNCVTDAACASTFSAMSMAVNELLVGQSDLVIAGGCDTMNDIFMYTCFSKTPALSPTGDCRPFSADADGTMLGEGLGMVAMKRLSDAERAGDRVYAVLRGIGSSSDGKALSVYAPLAKGQAKAVRRAYAVAGYGPDTVELIEAHGTGTKAGDAAEFEGIDTVFNESGRKDRNWCAIGSVKSQIGHTKSAAGAASFIKTVLALHHKVLPPTIKVSQPNPKMGIEKSAFYLNTKARPWIRSKDHPRRAGVSSFGFGGTNFHLTLEEYIGPGEEAARSRTADAELVLVSAKDAAALSQALTAMAAEVEAALKDERTGMLPFLARSTQEAFESLLAQKGNAARVGIVATDDPDLVAKLRAAAEKVAGGKAFSMPNGIHFEMGAHEGKVAFLFPGQGSQSLGMSADVAMTWDAARSAWDLASNVPMGGERLHEVCFPKPVFDPAAAEAQQKKLTATEWAQPALGAASLAYFRLMESIGLLPSAVAGHSFGEVMALCAAGAISETDMLGVARKRGELMAEAGKSTKGAMTAVVLDAATLSAKIAKSGLDVVLANHNAPDQAVLSGPTDAIEAIETSLKSEGVTVKRLDVATAFHSDVVSAASAPFGAFLQNVGFAAPRCDVYANATAAPYPTDAKGARATLASQLALPVRFVDQIEAMYAAGVRTFVEVGPGSVLSGLVGKILGARPHRAIALDKRNNGTPSLAHFHGAIARLAVAGLPLKLGALWEAFEAQPDPRKTPKPKMKLMLNGSNYGKPYPPKGGTKALPKPNPERSAVRAAAPVAPATSMQANAGLQSVVTPAKVAPKTATNGNGHGTNGHVANGAPAARAVATTPSAITAPPSSAINVSSRPVTAMTQSNKPALPSSAQLAWIQAYQESSRQTAEAHATFAKAMGDAHAAFLRSAETSFVGLASMLTGQAPQLAALPAAAPSPSYTPSPAPSYAPTPSYASPAYAPAPTPAYTPAPAYTAPVVAPTPVAPTPAPSRAPSASAGPNVDLMQLMLDVVANKTGYPVEMIGMEMELEADLGIDSIKRVEILAAVREKAPGLPDLDPSALGALRTVGQIVEHLQKHLPASATRSAPVSTPTAPRAAALAPAASNVDLMKLMLEVVAQKTGYPVEMIGMEMELEADLGIDSIKRVEILAAVREQAPGLPDLDPSALGALRTVGQIVEHLQKHLPGASVSAPAPAAAPVAAASAPAAKGASVDLMQLMLEVVAQKTGYPVEMIGMEMELEADLGIDSIKRVEILAAVREQAPGLPDLDPSALGALRTVGQIVEHLQKHLPASSVAVPSSAATALSVAATKAAPAHRFVLRAVPRAASGLVSPALFSASRVVVTDDEAGVAHALVAELASHGVRAEVVVAVPADADAVILLEGLRAASSVDAALLASRAAFAQGRAVAARMASKDGGYLTTVQDTGGDFGLSGCTKEPLRAWLGGIAGLAKTAAQEWPKASVRAIDLERGGRSAELVAQALASELVHGGTELEVGVSATGARVVLESVGVSLDASAPLLQPGDVVVASGGARGVTAATLIELARATKCRLVLAGRTALETEPDAARGLSGDAALKKGLLEDAKKSGRAVTPAALGKQVEKILANREVLATIAAIAAVGGEARYVPVDVQDAVGLGKALDDVRASWGPIRGIVHGAGVLADKLIAEKTDDQFNRVFDTKVSGLRALLAATQKDPIRAIALFSSVAARTGNQGQVDYAMANEILNKVATAEAVRRRASDEPVVVKSLGWGPWEGGMVTPALKARFEQLGVPMISLAGGAKMLVDELASGSGDDVELVLGGEPKPEALLGGPAKTTHHLAVHVDRHTHPFIASHVVKGNAVLPAVSAIEIFARAARALAPSLFVSAVRDVAVLKGVVLAGFAGEGDRFVVEAKETSNGRGKSFAMMLTSPKGLPHYRAVVELAETESVAKSAPPDLGALTPIDDVVYDGFVLFHGPALHAISAVRGESAKGIEGSLVGRRALGWDAPGAETDTALLDGALQLAVLWTKHTVRGASLPTAIGSYVAHRGARTLEKARCVVMAKSHTADRASFDIALTDESGTLIAELRGVDVHVLPGSREELASRGSALLA